MPLKLEPLRVLTGAGEKPVTLEEHLKKALQVNEADPRPALVYFHWDHEGEGRETPHGKLAQKQCKLLDEEQVARWSVLFRCFEVEATESDRKCLDRLGAGTSPGFAVVDSELRVIAKSATLAPDLLIGFLQKAVTEGTPKYWKEVELQMFDQAELLKEARELQKQRKWREALERLDKIRSSTVRIAGFWDDAVSEAEKAEKKLKDG